MTKIPLLLSHSNWYEAHSAFPAEGCKAEWSRGATELSQKTVQQVKVSADTVLLQNSLLKLKLFVIFAILSSLIYGSENAGETAFNIFNLVFHGSKLLLSNNKNQTS